MILRRVTESDLSAVMEIEEASFIPSVREKREVFAERIRVCGSCFIIFEDETVHKPAGYFSAERWAAVPENGEAFILNHPASSYFKSDGRILYLSSFALLPEYRGRGTGHKIFAESIEWFIAHNKGIAAAVLLVNEAWKAAVHIYTQNGFRETHRLPGFFPQQQDAPSAASGEHPDSGSGANTDGIIMEKKLSCSRIQTKL
jgi:[ribosomal protein S18]-alanine N-acetyltransferase